MGKDCSGQSLCISAILGGHAGTIADSHHPLDELNQRLFGLKNPLQKVNILHPAYNGAP
jgi:hypothetical protein